MQTLSLKRNPWIALCAVLFTLAAACGVPGLISLGDPSWVDRFQFHVFYELRITDYETLVALTWLRPVVLGLTVLGPGLMAGLLWYVYGDTKGFRTLSLAAKWLFWASCAVGAAAALWILWEALRYAWMVIRGGVGILAVSMVIFEGVPVLLGVIVMFFLMKLLKRGEEAADMLYYISLGGTPDPTAVSTGLCVLLYLAGLATIACGIIRLPDVPGMLSFVLCGCADLTMGVLLRLSRRRMERAAFEERH